MVDELLMNSLEFCVIRLQNATGVPRWRMVCGLAVIWCGLCFVKYTSLPIPFYVFCAGGAVIMCTWFIRGELRFDRRYQEEADIKQAVIPNRLRYSVVGFTVRTVVWILVILGCFSKGRTLCNVTEQFIFALMLTVDHCNTWPMLGPSLKEWLKNSWKALTTRQVPKEA